MGGRYRIQKIFLMKTYIVAVSGGVDSVALLDMLYKKADEKLIVAHFDHGIRLESAEDAKFVGNLANHYGLAFETKREELGPKANEQLARSRRYKFLRELAKEHKATIVTAHHLDDLIESIAINLLRGTGWRGLSVMSADDIYRPLLNLEKQSLVDYAVKNKLSWREDSTNQTSNYLRNQVRRQTQLLAKDVKRQLFTLWNSQNQLKLNIDSEINSILPKAKDFDRYFFTHIDESSALELIRKIVDGKLTRPQMQGALHAIKAFRPGKIYMAAGEVEFAFTSRKFTVKMLKY